MPVLRGETRARCPGHGQDARDTGGRCKLLIFGCGVLLVMGATFGCWFLGCSAVVAGLGDRCKCGLINEFDEGDEHGVADEADEGC